MRFSFVVLSCLVFFFFKQKTAYDMRISWSSDVCSSDLDRSRQQLLLCRFFGIARRICQIQYLSGAGAQGSADGRSPGMGPGPPCGGSCLAGKKRASFGRQVRDRSEEHTSELQSLMRISYAVFCLKKKKKKSRNYQKNE